MATTTKYSKRSNDETILLQCPRKSSWSGKHCRRTKALKCCTWRTTKRSSRCTEGSESILKLQIVAITSDAQISNTLSQWNLAWFFKFVLFQVTRRFTYFEHNSQSADIKLMTFHCVHMQAHSNTKFLGGCIAARCCGGRGRFPPRHRRELAQPVQKLRCFTVED